MKIDVTLGPTEFNTLKQRDLSGTTCVVFDVLRATSSMLTALNNGASAIIPVSEIPEALQVLQQCSDVLLAGERHGLRITREQTGSVDFHFGNSPRDFAADKVSGKTIAWTTTNGTRALRSCSHAGMILLGGLVNLSTVAEIIRQLRPPQLLFVCSGTFEDMAYEDTFAAGALVDKLATLSNPSEITDAAHIAHGTFIASGRNVSAITTSATNARKLLGIPALKDDVAICLAQDSIRLNATLLSDGSIRPMGATGSLLA